MNTRRVNPPFSIEKRSRSPNRSSVEDEAKTKNGEEEEEKEEEKSDAEEEEE